MARLISCFALAIALLPAMAQPGDPTPTPAGAATKVFISNLTSTSEDANPTVGGPDRTYNVFYAAIQSLGQYELVMDPAQADVIFELGYINTWWCQHDPLRDREGVESPRYFSQLTLLIRDGKTSVPRAAYNDTIQMDVTRTIQSILEQAGMRAVRVPKEKQVKNAPVPPQISASTQVFLSNAVADRTQVLENHEEIYNQFYAALEKWGRYKLVSSPAESGLIMNLAVTQKTGQECRGNPSTTELQLELSVSAPNARFALWGFSQPLRGVKRSSRDKLGISPQGLEKAASGLINQLRRIAQSAP